MLFLFWMLSVARALGLCKRSRGSLAARAGGPEKKGARTQGPECANADSNATNFLWRQEIDRQRRESTDRGAELSGPRGSEHMCKREFAHSPLWPMHAPLGHL